MNSRGMRRPTGWSIIMPAVVAGLVTVAVLAVPAGATMYNIQKNQQLYGNLNQNQIPNGGQYMCGPTAAVNSFVYLENAYPNVYGRSLVPDNNPPNGQHDLAEMITAAQTVGGPNNMNTKANLNGGGGGAGTWDDMFIYGKMNYIEASIPNVTTYAAQMMSQWAWVGNPPRPADEVPPIAKPAWVQDKTVPTWQFLYNELNDCEDVEILIVDGDWGHYLTATGFTWNDADNDFIIDPNEGAQLSYIDPATGNPGVSALMQQGLGTPIFVNYGSYPYAQLVMTVSESPIPEPATMTMLAAGGLLALLRRKRH